MDGLGLSLAVLLQAQALPGPAVSGGFWNIRASDLALMLATAVTSGVMIWAVIQAPKWAVKIQWDLQLLKEERDRRLALFKTLMSTRATPVDFRHVQALNMIDVEFSSQSAEDLAVRSAWRDYLDALNNHDGFNDPSKVESRRDLLAELLQRMGEALNYSFDFAYLKGRVYYPVGHEDDAAMSTRMTKAVLEIVEGTRPLQVQTAGPGASVEDAASLGTVPPEAVEGRKTRRAERIHPPAISLPRPD